MRAHPRLLPLIFAILLPNAHGADCGVHKDFMIRADPTLAPVRPVDCAPVVQSPPEFTWPPVEGQNRYSVVLKLADGRVESRSTPNNWLLWDEVLPPGEYAWHLKVAGAQNEASEWRRFTIAADSIAFVVPATGALLTRARAVPRPRSWAQDGSTLAALKEERSRNFSELLKDVDDAIDRPVQPEPVSSSKGSNYDDTVTEQKRTLAAAFAWAGTRRTKYGAEGARRLLAQARWSTSGPIAYSNNDMASRTVAWTLALGYDWMHDYLSEADKAAIRAAIRARTLPMFNDLKVFISAYPYNSHGNLTLTLTAAIGALMAGEIPEADDWVKEAVPMAVAWTSPWGWGDGGFGNGTEQMFWDTGSNLVAWYVFRNSLGVDLARKEWVRNLGRFMAYFVPPGAPAGGFGDGQEMYSPELWSRIGKAYARFAPSPLASWYANQMNKEDGTRLELLLAPREPSLDAAFPAGTPNGALFASVGWVAMHSDLADPARASIYFKSSPFGSFNHSHADQNSFIVNFRGRRLAIASGYYDDYGTAHWKDWYKQTRAANAVTFDGGQGQAINEMSYSGKIVAFASHRDFDYAVGRAEPAYNGALERAQRSIAYLRPDVIVVYDRLASASARRWEWNVHALERMAKMSERKVALRNGAAQMCVELIAGPEVAFRQQDRFTSAPRGQRMPNQWHGAFVATTPSEQAEFVALMRLGSDCTSRDPAASAARLADGWKVDVGGRSVAFEGERVTVR